MVSCVIDRARTQPERQMRTSYSRERSLLVDPIENRAELRSASSSSCYQRAFGTGIRASEAPLERKTKKTCEPTESTAHMSRTRNIIGSVDEQ